MWIAWVRLPRAQVRVRMLLGVLGWRQLLSRAEGWPAQAQRLVGLVTARVWQSLPQVVLLRQVAREGVGKTQQTWQQAQEVRTAQPGGF